MGRALSSSSSSAFLGGIGARSREPAPNERNADKLIGDDYTLSVLAAGAIRSTSPPWPAGDAA